MRARISCPAARAWPKEALRIAYPPQLLNRKSCCATTAAFWYSSGRRLEARTAALLLCGIDKAPHAVLIILAGEELVEFRDNLLLKLRWDVGVVVGVLNVF